MSVIDIDKLTAALSPDSPSGDNLDFDLAFMNLEREAERKPDQRIGDEVMRGEEPEWTDVRSKALALLERTRDLRIAITLTRALLQTDGLPGFSDGVALVRGLVENLWDDVHPRLDPEDGFDPTARVNAIAGLADPGRLLLELRRAPLVGATAETGISVRDALIVTGRLPAPADETPPDAAGLAGAVAAADIAALRRDQEALAAVTESLAAIEATTVTKTQRSPELKALLEVVRDAAAILLQYAASGEGAVSASRGASAGASPLSGTVNSRDDVTRLLDMACGYFERHEPSSPLPYLLRRARRLVGKDFLVIMRDLAPEGLHQARAIAGEPEEGS